MIILLSLCTGASEHGCQQAGGTVAQRLEIAGWLVELEAQAVYERTCKYFQSYTNVLCHNIVAMLGHQYGDREDIPY